MKGVARGLTPTKMEVEGEDDGADGVGVGLDWGGGEGGGPSRLRLENEGKCCLPSDMTRRRPAESEGDSRRWRGRPPLGLEFESTKTFESSK